VEAYLAVIALTVLLSHGLFPEFRRSASQLLAAIPTLTDRVSSGEIANNLGNNLGWADEQADQIRIVLQHHRANVEGAAAKIEQSAPAALAGIVVIPILAIFFLSDGENLANQVIHLVSTNENHAAVRSLADELHVMLQRYIRAKVILGGLTLTYCSVAMLVLGFPNAIVLGVLAGILEFIPVAGWMTAAAIIVTAGVLSHSHWIWMLALLAVWRILMDYGIAPRVMGHELEIHPLLAIFTLMVGGAVGGIVGVYLSVPLVAACGSSTEGLRRLMLVPQSPAVLLTARNQEERPPWWPDGRVETEMVMQRVAPAADASHELIGTSVVNRLASADRLLATHRSGVPLSRKRSVRALASKVRGISAAAEGTLYETTTSDC